MLYVLRHGKTDWNAQYRLQGRTDIPLNDEGREMARKAALEYKDVNFDVCYCSPLIRARETAQLLLEGRNVPIIYEDRLMEMGFGEYEGVVNYLGTLESPISVIFKHPENYTESIGGSETFEELFARTGSFLNEIAIPLVKAGKDVLIVGHGAMNLSITCQVKNIPIKDYWSTRIDNCKLNRLM